MGFLMGWTLPVPIANFFATWAMQWQLLSEGSFFSFLTIALLIPAKDGLHHDHNHNCKAEQLSSFLPSFLQLCLSSLWCLVVRAPLPPSNEQNSTFLLHLIKSSFPHLPFNF
jgi:hypothetical protein